MRPLVPIAALAVGMAGCREPPLPAEPLPPLVSRPRAPAPIPPLPGFVPGERMTWKVSWRGLVVGRAQLVTERTKTATGGPPGGAPALAMTSELRLGGLITRGGGVVMRLTTVTSADGRPIESRELWPGRPRSRRVRTRFASSRYRSVLRGGGPPSRVLSGRAPGGAARGLHDLHTALASLRDWATRTPRRRGFLYAVFSGRLYRVEVAAPIRAPGERGVRVPIRATRAGRPVEPGDDAPLEISLRLSGPDQRALDRIEIDTGRGQVVAELVD